MDYLFFTSLGQREATDLVVSYDVACQWSVNLWDQMKLYPPNLRLANDSLSVTFLVPKFHLPAHVATCQTGFSFNYTPHVGCTDGEAPERGWSHINPLATSTHEVGPGARRDTIDDHFSDWNWKKTTGLGE
jgi:hypothetical protein